MSTKRGNNTRTRAQKYQNRTAFKNDLYDKTPQTKMLNSLHICEVCQHCKAVIEWKIKYKKYKPLTKPKTCIKCQNRNIKKAYHVVCRDCALKEKICAKCLKSSFEVNIEPAGPTEEEQIKLKVEMDRLIKSLPERKRRTFVRYMEKGKEQIVEVEPQQENIEKENCTENDAKVKDKETTRIPHTREDLLKKIEELKLTEEDNDDISGFNSSDEDFTDENCSD